MRKKLPRLIYPLLIERKYTRALVSTVPDVTKIILAEFDFRQDGKIDDVIARLKKRFAIRESDARQATEQALISTNRHHLADFNESYGKALGIQAIGAEWEQGLSKQFIADNVALIKSIPEQMLDQVGDVVRVSLEKGTRVEVVTKRLQERFGVGQSRARLIARDQIGKLYGDLNAQRQQAAGVESFEWSTSRDDDVRDLHRDLEGKEYDYPEGHPTEGLPGQPVQCRCSAIPVVDL